MGFEMGGMGRKKGKGGEKGNEGKGKERKERGAWMGFGVGGRLFHMRFVSAGNPRLRAG